MGDTVHYIETVVCSHRVYLALYVLFNLEFSGGCLLYKRSQYFCLHDVAVVFPFKCENIVVYK